MAVLPRDFYLQDAVTVAQQLLGKVLVHQTPQGLTAGKIVETEAYCGPEDAAAHSYQHKGRQGRTAIQYGPGGFAYVYLIYGMYDCMNVVANVQNKPEAVLLRALEPLRGLELMASRRHTQQVKNLCSGPGKLAMAMGIDRGCYGLDLCASNLWIEEGAAAVAVVASKRVNVDYAGEAKDYPWRFTIRDNPFVSVKAAPVETSSER